MLPESPQDKESQLWNAYYSILAIPFNDKYEDKWDEKAFSEATENFKIESKNIGYENPFEMLGTNCEAIRNKLKAGPLPCFRKGWKSPLTGETIDILSLIQSLVHGSGPVFEANERIVVVDFWATWCEPCLKIAPRLSDIYDKHNGRVSIIGICNDGILGPDRHNIESTKEFIESHKESMRYSSHIDAKSHVARDSFYRKIEFKGVPCIVLLVDNVVRYAGGPGTSFFSLLDEVIQDMYPL